MRKFVAKLLVAMLCITTLTACESGQAGTTNESTPASVQEQSADAQESISAQENTEAQESKEDASEEEPGDAGEEVQAPVESKGVLKVGTNAEFPPFEYMGDDGQPDGFDMALIKAIGEKLGYEVQIENMEFGSLVAAIGSKIDVAIAGMTVSEERAQVVDFSDNYYEAVQYVIVPEGQKFNGIADLEKKTIGVQLGTTGNFIADEIEKADVKSYNKAVDAVNDLINGRLDAVIIDKNPAQVFESKFSDKIDIIEGDKFDFETEYYAIACPKGSELVSEINKALKELQDDGTFDELVQKYIETN